MLSRPLPSRPLRDSWAARSRLRVFAQAPRPASLQAARLASSGLASRNMTFPKWRPRAKPSLAAGGPPNAKTAATASMHTASTEQDNATATTVPWLPEDADVGITGVLPAADGGDDLFEVSVRFAAMRTLWRARRSYADFQRLHTQLEARCAPQLLERKLHLPRPARLSWEAAIVRSSPFATSSKAKQGADVPPRLERQRVQLNGYLHRLLELDAVHATDAFRAFLTPRPGSNDVELSGKAFPEQVLTKCLSHPVLPITTKSGLGGRALSRLRKTHRKPPVASTSSPPAAAFPTDAKTTSCRSVPPPPAVTQCGRPVHYGGSVALSALGGLGVGLTKRSALSGSHKAVAMAAAGVAGVALTGPLSAVLALGALGSGVGRYQLNKTYYLSVDGQSKTVDGQTRAATGAAAMGGVMHAFLVESAEQFSGPRRPVKFGDAVHLYCKAVRKSVRVAAPPDSKRGHLMVTGAEGSKTTLRLVSPYGHTGVVSCGSHAFLEIASGEWSGQCVGLHGELLATGSSPTVFRVGLGLDASGHAPTCPEARNGHESVPASPASSESPASPVKSLESPAAAATASTAITAATTAAAAATTAAASAAPFRLRVMTYNVWLLPSIVSSFSDKLSPATNQRARAIPQFLAPLDLDVVVFCEAFDSTARELLVAGMKDQGFLYETKAIGAGASFISSKKAIDSGCFAMSRFPIAGFQELPFGSVSAGDDRMADKGVLYFQVRVPGVDGSSWHLVHVIGTHLQAWDTPAAVSTRQSQLRLVRQFMDSLRIPTDEPIVVAGDLNVNKCRDDPREYRSMLEVLDAEDPALRDESPAFSFDPLTNSLAVDGPSSSGETELLDYVLVRQTHRRPVRSSSEVVQLKATPDWRRPDHGPRHHDDVLVDLSDHYPVVAEFDF